MNFSTDEACRLTGVTKRQIEHWDTQQNWISPSVKAASGSGSRRVWSEVDVLALKVISALSEERQCGPMIPAVWEALHLYPVTDYLVVGNAMAMPVSDENLPMVLSNHPSGALLSIVCVAAYRAALFPEDVPA